MIKFGKNNFIDLENRPRVELAPGIESTILTGDHDEGMMMVLTEVAPGVKVPMHAHPHEQMGMVFSGSARVTIAGETKIMNKGDFCYFPSDVEHEAECIGDEPFVMLDIFRPVRDDFLEKIEYL